MSTSRQLRRVGRALVPVGIAAAIVSTGASPALADSSVTINGSSSAEIDQHTVLSVVGRYDNSTSASSKTVQLLVTDPSGTAHVLYSGTAGAFKKDTLPTQTFDTDCEPWGSGCAEPNNGDYTFVVKLGGVASSPASVWLRLPPATVSTFHGSASGTVAMFSWQPNSDPGLTAYDIRDASGSVTPGGLDPGSVCDAGGCSVSIQFGSNVQGTDHDFSMVAIRKDGHRGTVSSTPYGASVHFPAPQSPSSGGGGSTSGGTTGGHQSGSGGGSTSGSTGGHQSGSGATTGTGAHRVSGRHPAADLRAYLPTVTAGAAPDLPSVVTEVKPLPIGTYKPTLAYNDQVRRDKMLKPRPSASIADNIVSIIDMAPLWRAIAGAAVLMLVAVHLRAWIERVEVD